MSKTSWIFGWVFAVLVALACGQPTAQAHERSGEVRGEIVALVPATGTEPAQVTLRRGRDTVTLFVTSDTEIEIDGEEGEFADLAVGQRAEAHFDPATRIATSIEVDIEDEEEPRVLRVVGVVTAVGADSVSGLATVSLDTDGGGVPDLTLRVDGDTTLRLGRIELAEEELPLLVGLRVAAEYEATTFLARKIEADVSGAAMLTGEVTAVNLDARSVTLTTASGNVTLVVPEETQVRLHGRRVGLEAARVGDTLRVVALANGAGQQIALAIEIVTGRPRHVVGRLTAVGADSLTVESRAGSVTLTVDATTDLRLNGRPTTLAALQALLAEGRTVQVSAQYFVRGGANVATQVRANARGRGRR